ncbi:acyl-CoA thioesterase [Psychrosphaera ytuae]|uniref:Acyl-CoA thioesterase n=1 Tax=Psychrosphaera ytuae TaxID=2820710 RepID=A0A975DGE1_9GAMM|nr:thioesterase family protein [Psychrosphaera ytuae]QTH65170.1 acyl-CoA thioesterase [Psychrosphaera ytuae]
MFSITLQPRFAETDALQHINNTVIPVWFESARPGIFKIFNPEQNIQEWNLIIAKIEVNYLAQIHYGPEVEIRTHISKLGRSSMTILQEVWQSGKRAAWGETVMVKFDYQTNQASPISEQERKALEQHLVDKDELLSN